MAQAGVVGQAEVEMPTTAMGSPSRTPRSPAFWGWVFFVISVLIVMGFHLRLFGITIPPQP